jgi:hypothetical protein
VGLAVIAARATPVAAVGHPLSLPESSSAVTCTEYVAPVVSPVMGNEVTDPEGGDAVVAVMLW